MVFLLPRVAAVSFLVVAVFAADKQIKLEDIEKDNLKADQQAKFEKQYEQYQSLPYQTAFQANSYAGGQNYQAGAFAYPSQLLNYQHPSAAQYAQLGLANSYQQAPAQQYSQLALPNNYQQYLQQALYQSPYSQLSGNALGGGFQQAQHAAMHPLQAYLSQQYQGLHNAQPVSAATQQQPIVMAFANPSFGGSPQHAAYYQALQYLMSGQNGPLGQYYYQTQQEAAPQVPSSPPQSTPLLYTQQDLPNFQSINSAKPLTYLQAPRQGTAAFPTASPYAAQAFVSTEAPSYLSPYKVSPTITSSLGQQHQQYYEAIGSTMSPLQTKYMNSPQYLAQNYNTIPSTHLFPKAAYAGVKSTVSPPIKVAPQGGFSPISTNSNASSNSGSSYQSYNRNTSGK